MSVGEKMGLGKHFYTAKNEGGKLTAREEYFFGIRKDAPKRVGRPKKEVDIDKKSTLDIIKDLLK